MRKVTTAVQNDEFAYLRPPTRKQVAIAKLVMLAERRQVEREIGRRITDDGCLAPVRDEQAN